MERLERTRAPWHGRPPRENLEEDGISRKGPRGTVGTGSTRQIKIDATAAYYGGRVVLYQDTWDSHILPQHPEVENREDLIVETLWNPEIILEDFAGAASSLFVSDPITGFFAGSRMHVAVSLTGSPKLVRTVYLSQQRPRGTEVYRRKKR